MRDHSMKIAGFFLVLALFVGGSATLQANEIRSFTTQNINVNKPRAYDQAEQIAPAAGVEQHNDLNDIEIVEVDEVVEEDITVESVTEDLAVANPVEDQTIPDDISDMMSEINVNAGIEGSAKADTSYKLGPDDKIKITVFGEEDLSGEFVVNGDGAITFPLLGNVAIEGMDVAKLGQMLETRLKGDYLKDPNVSVEVVQNRPFYILGEVREPGSYDFVNGMNILKAVAISGGFTYRANRKSIDVMRSSMGSSTPEKMKPTDTVQPGDIIYVRERFF